MQGTENVVGQRSGDALLSVRWADVRQDLGDPALEAAAAAFVSTLASTLETAGYRPRRLDVELRHRSGGAIDLALHGDVPEIPFPDFVSLARVMLASPAQRHAFGQGRVPRLSVALGTAPRTEDVTPPAERHSLPVARIVLGVVLGLALGVVGLPRLELSLPNPFASAAAPVGNPVERQPDVTVAESGPRVVRQTPTRTTLATPNAVVAPTLPPAAPAAPGLLLAERFVKPLLDWPDDVEGNAWFAHGTYRLFARQPGRFVAIGVPLPQTVGAAVLSANFRKVGGPSGGGYGIIIRAQGPSSERDSRSQAGNYLVLEVGDQGDAGIWRRDGTRWIDVMPWTHSDVVRQGREPNALSITTRGATLHYSVNGQTVADLTYTDLPPEGGVGIFVGGDLNEVALDSLQIESVEN